MVYQVKLSQYKHRRTVSCRLNFRDTNPFYEHFLSPVKKKNKRRKKKKKRRRKKTDEEWRRLIEEIDSLGDDAKKKNEVYELICCK